MARIRHSEEQIINKLRQADVWMGEGRQVPDVCKQLGISQQTFYKWRKKYGGMEVPQAKRLKELERENARLKKLVAEQALDNAMLKEIASGKF